ncbi:tetratricopeptide repeat protein [Prevotella sp. E13-17]|uniref:tetratricopeptide repeat protein n=1 Tax=Prevotella sp. E13-17 TaxID=2913616 RepID=UPI00351D778D
MKVLRALWGYVGDKMNISVEQLSRDNISERFNERQVDQQVINQFVEAIDECEFERYAPGDSKVNMSKVYNTAMTAIEHVEKYLLLLLLFVFVPISSHAVSKAEADSSYISGNYQLAVKQYKQILEQGVCAELYYNLGNAYYRTDDFTQAIIAYERALRLSPADGDIKHNLQMARSKTVDKITPESELFFVTWYHAFINLLSANGWAYLSLGSLTLTIVLMLLYLFSNPLWIRKLGFFGGIASLFVFVLAIIFAWQQQSKLSTHNEAIITVSAVSIKSAPSEGGKDIFLLHEGTKVSITDDTMNEWKEIRISDGKKGWIEADKMEII